MSIDVRHGDCLDVLRDMPDNSVDSILTDPPYGLSNMKPAQVADVLKAWVTGDTVSVPAKRGGFMGKDWDSFVPPPAVWQECLRVLKPGGHMAVFSGARTQDLMGLSIRLAGFEVRDTLGWIYGSGFPKSMDISKAIDKARSEDTEPVKAVAEALRAALDASGKTRKEIDAHFGTANVSQYWFSPHRKSEVPPVDKWPWLRDFLGIDSSLDAEVWRLNGRKGTPGEAWEKREVVGKNRWTNSANHFIPGEDHTARVHADITAPATSEAKRWDGWGTALKPAIEPIILARKPLDGTVAQNVLAHGVGGLNIDASRVGTYVNTTPSGIDRYNQGYAAMDGSNRARLEGTVKNASAGRFPANVLLDEHAAAEIDGQSDDSSRFFPVFKYQAKAPKCERPVIELEDGTKVQHPTVKPVALMEWLVTLITPPGGTVLDPFAGSGSTLEASRNKGFNSIGIEREADYIRLIEARLEP